MNDRFLKILSRQKKSTQIINSFVSPWLLHFIIEDGFEDFQSWIYRVSRLVSRFGDSFFPFLSLVFSAFGLLLISLFRLWFLFDLIWAWGIIHMVCLPLFDHKFLDVTADLFRFWSELAFVGLISRARFSSHFDSALENKFIFIFYIISRFGGTRIILIDSYKLLITCQYD